MELDPRTQRRLERIKEEVDILALLEDFGFHVRADMDREQQFSCRLHGDGRDSRPSARVYPETHSWYCWACQKSRDAVSTVREIQNISFMEAVKWLEAKNQLPDMPFEAGDTVYRPKAADAVVAEVLAPLSKERTFEQDAKALHSILEMVTEDRILPLSRITAYWEAFDRILYYVQGKGQAMSEHQGRVALEKVKGRVMAEVRGGRAGDLQVQSDRPTDSGGVADPPTAT
jgi:hypothetical protein